MCYFVTLRTFSQQLIFVIIIYIYILAYAKALKNIKTTLDAKGNDYFPILFFKISAWLKCVALYFSKIMDIYY